MKKKIISFVIALALAVPAALGAFPRFLEGAAGEYPIPIEFPVEINAANFPDENFRNYIIDKEKNAAGANKNNGWLDEEEAAQITQISLDDKGIKSFKGIEYLTSLTYLNCGNNKISELDLRNNKELKALYCLNNYLSYAFLNGVQVSDLKLDGLDKLKILSCGYNKLTCLDLSSCTALESLYCSGNNIASLDLSNLTSLGRVEINSNDMKDLNVSGCTALANLWAKNNKLTSLDISSNEQLTFLDCQFNSITHIDFCENNQVLNYIDICDNMIERIDTEKIPQTLVSFYASNNNISAIDLSGLKNLTYLRLDNNKLTSLDVSDNVNICELYCSNNPITELDLSNNKWINELKCSSTNLPYLNLDFLTVYENENGTCYSFGLFSCEDNNAVVKHCTQDPIEIEPAALDEEKTFDFDLTKIAEGFDISRAKFSDDAVIEGNILKNVKIGDTITYSYDIGAEYDYININDNTYNTFKDLTSFSVTFEEGHSLVKVDDTFTCSGAADLWRCEECGRYFDADGNEVTVSDAHNFTETVQTPPTCSKEGVTIKKCLNCGYEEYVYTDKLPHTYDNESEYECDYCRHWRKCTVCGEKFNEEYHEIDPATNTCTICKQTFDHIHNIMDEYVPAAEPTCTQAGMKGHYYCPERRIYWLEYTDQNHIAEVSREDLILDPLGHDYVSKHDGENHWLQCTRCGEIKEGSLHTHNIDAEGVIVKPATCGEEGLKEYRCSDCDYVREEVLPIAGAHTFTDKFKDLPDQDQHVRICDVCGAEEEFTRNHNDSIQVIPPTCCEKGKMVYTCNDCGRIKEEEGAAPTGEHKLSEYKHNENEHWKACENEGCTYETAREEHIWDEGVITLAPTVENKGEKVYTCTVCGYQRSEYLDRLEPPEATPVQTVPTQTEPVQTEPTQTEPIQTKPDQTEPAQTEPVQTEPTQTEPTRPIYTWPTQPTPITSASTTAPQTKPTTPVTSEKAPVVSGTTTAKTEPIGTNPTVTNSIGTNAVSTKPIITVPTSVEPIVTTASATEPDVIVNESSAAATEKSPSAIAPDSSANGNVGGNSSKDDDNISTGLIISVIPAAISGISVLIFKKKNKKK